MTQFNQFFSKAIIIFSIFTITNLQAQNTQELGTQVNLLFGLNQPMIGGFNAELNVFHERFVFDYSHGVSLNLAGAAAPAVLSDVGLEAHLPYTTGFGVGYRFNKWFNLRFEPKWHQFEILYTGETSNPIEVYNTVTLGIGAYTFFKPFKNQDNLLKGISIAPSLRYWYNVSSTLDNNEFSYFNTTTNQTETHQALNVGLNNTPWIVNISIGYSIDL